MKRRIIALLFGIGLLLFGGIVYTTAIKPPSVTPSDAIALMTAGDYEIYESGVLYAAQGQVSVNGNSFEDLLTNYTRSLRKVGDVYVYHDRVQYKTNGRTVWGFEIHVVLQGGSVAGYAIVNGTRYDITSMEWQNKTMIRLDELVSFIRSGYQARLRGMLEKSQLSEKTSWLDISGRTYEGTYAGHMITFREQFSGGNLESVDIKLILSRNSTVNVMIRSVAGS
ncbi:hypothetical protein [Thermococcus thioreducens]|uniref:Uncharacterized protein n=1 Tax=Thermococcus thioreducens TaxID=277988 RepID=A0A0Q2RC78_9EURY|nr:hypothetical protein [Thermococcus thioreducens]ASJ12140.1 hypothetical protein A3L14_04250 [Thermococcus thioreducens]KQH81542.1 hypothetical protein AMR53_10645 [Thermococcus thioreducens]SEV96207.1 hypothetical protein SAMN05216170_1118 [Thermococcus thioreducens]